MDPQFTPAAVNHNPLNMRPLPNGEKWQGQIGSITYAGTGAFCQFSDNRKGVRAAVINMRSIVRLGRNTLGAVINTWAPPSENVTSAYLNNVCAYSSLPSNYDLSWLSSASVSTGAVARNTLAKIIKGMNIVEAGGETITLQDALDGIDDAIGAVPVGYTRQDDGNVMRTFVAQSETVKSADTGIQTTALGAVAGVGVPLLSTVSGAPWPVVAIIAGCAVLCLAGFAIYRLVLVKNERVKMHEAGIA